jgi:Fe2+ transport system protein FeoA
MATPSPTANPIPDSNLNLPPAGSQALLTEQEPGFAGRIARVGTQDRDELNLFRQLGLVPGADLTLVGTDLEGLRVRTGTEPYLLPRPLAQKLWVERIAP